MKEELERRLAEEYPEIFDYWNKEPDEIEGPPPSITIYGFRCGDGWYNLVESLCETLERLDVNIKVSTVKEKYGGLRFYHDGVSHPEDEKKAYMAMGAIQQAEEMSFHVCEECGDSGEIRTSGWYRTLCDECWSEEKARRRELLPEELTDE